MILNYERKPIEQTERDRNLTDAIFHECLSASNMSLAGLARKYSAEHPDKSTTAQNITNKIARDSMKLREFAEYLNLIGFDIVITPNGNGDKDRYERVIEDHQEEVRQLKEIEEDAEEWEESEGTEDDEGDDIPYSMIDKIERIAYYTVKGLTPNDFFAVRGNIERAFIVKEKLEIIVQQVKKDMEEKKRPLHAARVVLQSLVMTLTIDFEDVEIVEVSR